MPLMEVPLSAVRCQNVVDVDFESADPRARTGLGAHDALVENGGRVDPMAGPGSSLPGPPAAGCARRSDNTIGRGPLTHIDSSVNPGTLNPKNRVDSAKPLQRNAVPGIAIDVLIDREEDRRTLAAARGGVQLPGGARIRDAAGIAPRAVRRR